ncbi:hypothetical protein CTAYLR_005678 [Chrysophaeum taylorii]|uniref:Uncharacterized protein n=1 Tax=Chrysophaeum taylorii TaxID=2483200 RepID=A0AAD7XQD7_9STRA|nr:hypothetical protein CTAYLR_005678 [Chrysophaeum taylorii]
MLAADKILLESSIRQSATSLKEKEFLLHHDNLTTVGTQAAVMAGFTVTALIEFGPKSGSRALKFLYYNAVILSLSANILCVAKTTCLSVMGTSLATRGPEGAMARAVEGIFQLRQQIFALFGVGMLSLLFTGILGSWLILETLPATVATAILVVAIYSTYTSYNAIRGIFHFDEDDAVSFDDILSRFRSKSLRGGVQKEEEEEENHDGLDPPPVLARASSSSGRLATTTG